jgi:hypothetical protein
MESDRRRWHYVQRGMVGLKDDLPPTEIEAIRALVINRAQAEA